MIFGATSLLTLQRRDQGYLAELSIILTDFLILMIAHWPYYSLYLSLKRNMIKQDNLSIHDSELLNSGYIFLHKNNQFIQEEIQNSIEPASEPQNQYPSYLSKSPKKRSKSTKTNTKNKKNEPEKTFIFAIPILQNCMILLKGLVILGLGHIHPSTLSIGLIILSLVQAWLAIFKLKIGPNHKNGHFG